jgi:anti-sigma factor RsiW
MNNCRWTIKVEAWFDGEAPEPGAIERHVDQCAVCAAHVARLRKLRGFAREAAAPAAIADPQFPAFMDGIRERIEAPRRRHGFWTLASLTATAMIVAFAAFLMMTWSTPKGAFATRVESYSTELEGATVQAYSSDDGTALVYISLPEEKNW